MNETAPEFCFQCPTHAAVRAYSKAGFAILAHKVIARLQRIPASGIFGDDFCHKTLWDEFCQEQQHGPHDLLEDAWRTTLDTILDNIVTEVPHHEMVLLTIGARWELNEIEESESDIAPNPSLVSECLERHLKSLATDHDLSRFDPLGGFE